MAIKSNVGIDPAGTGNNKYSTGIIEGTAPIVPSAAPVIPAANLQATNPVQTVTPPVDTTNHAGIISGAADNVQTAFDTANKTLTDLQTANNDSSNPNSVSEQILSLMGQESNKAADTQAANDTAGVTALVKQLNDLNAQAKNLNLEAQAIPLQTQENNRNTGATDAGVAPQTAGALRINALKALSISQQANVAMGNYQAAKDNAQRIIDLKYLPIENKLAVLKQQYDFNKDALTVADAKRAEALNALISKQETDIADQKATETANLNQANIYAKDAMDAGQSDIAAQITQLDTGSPTFRADLARLQTQILPVLTTAQKNAGLKSVPTTTTSNGSSGQTATTTGSIQNDVQAILEGRNTMYNIRQTMGRTNAAAAYMQKIRDSITAVDPSFDFVASDAGGKSVSSSYVQRATAAINSVLPNIDIITKLSDQVGRVGVKGVDSVLQKAALQVGDAKVSNFRQAQKLIADEIGVALGAGTVSDMKLELGFDITDPTVQPEIFASNMQLVKQFLENRKDGLNSLRYSSSTVAKSSLNPNDVHYTLQSNADKDGYVSPDSWSKMEDLFVKSGGTADDFNAQYGSFKNPNNHNYK